MKIGFYWVGLILAIAVQFACDGFTKDIDVDYSDHQAKGVILSILSNKNVLDTAFRPRNYFVTGMQNAYINRTYITNSAPPSFSRGNFYRAQVTLESNDGDLPLTFIEGNREQNIDKPFFVAQGEIFPGRAYHISAAFDPDAAPQDMQEWTPVSASDTMPNAVSFSIENVRFEYPDGKIQGTPKEGFFDLKIEDEPGRVNMYYVEVSAIFQRKKNQSQNPYLIYGNIERPDKSSDLDFFRSSENDLFHEDDFRNEGRKRIRFRFSKSYGSHDREKPALFLIRISNLSDNYIRFQRSSQQYSLNKDNPFAEPAEIFTNVHNGYGIFALVARSYGEVEVK